MEREKLGSRLGFILLSAGCAIGVGNVWKFPYITGENGGGAFVVIYLLFLIILGIPAVTIEFALGRASQRSPIGLYKVLEPAGSKWHIHGYMAFAGNLLLMMFYTVVAGWMLYYYVETARGSFEGMDTEQVSQVFGNLCQQPGTMAIYTIVTIVVTCLVLSFSLQGGLERVTKYLMIILLALMVILAVNGLTMEGAKEGISFYLKPDFTELSGGTIVAAMNQAFFTLSIGIGSMAIFGSYIGKDRALMGEAVSVVCLDTFVAIVAGLIIFPACFTFGVAPGAGPSLIFVTLPNIFIHMNMGRIWGSLFFMFMTFAAFSTVLAVFENILAMFREITGLERKKAAWISCFAMIILSMPCALGFNVLSGIQPLGDGSTIQDLEDFIVSYCLLPIGALIYTLFATRKNGLGWDAFLEEVNTGKGLKMPGWMRGYCSYVLPLIIIALFIIGLLDYFT